MQKLTYSILIAILGVAFNSIHAQNQILTKQELIERLFGVSQVKQQTEKMCEFIILRYLRETDQNLLYLKSELLERVDYSSYLNEVREVYNRVYTEEEINELIQLTQSNQHDLLKKKTMNIQGELYNIGKSFGKNIQIQLIENLKSLSSKH